MSKGFIRRLFAGITILGTISVFQMGLPQVSQASAIIVNGDSALGVNDAGHLNTFGEGPDGFATYGVWRIGLGDATSPGCLCEGWGVAVTDTSGFRAAGFANESSGSGGLTGGVFGSTVNTASSTINLSEAPVEVVHLYGPSIAPDVFQAQVSVTNTSATETMFDMVYRRAMDWDVPPTEFNEYVTHQGVEANLESVGGNVRYASDNGFASSDPRSSAGSMDPSTINVDFVENGPNDHGSVFDFAFGDLAPGETRSFNIFYGTAADEAGALASIAILDPDVYSLGQSTDFSGGPANDMPTFLFAFGGVGGVAPGSDPEHPILPFVPAPGEFEFPAPQPRRWYDPPFADTFAYELVGSDPTLGFTEVGAPPASFGFGDVDVEVGGIVVATLSAGEIYTFSGIVKSFLLTGIDPLLDIADPLLSTAFPTWLDWTGIADDLHMTAIPLPAGPATVPEPSTMLLLAGGLTAVSIFKRKISKNNN